MTADIRTTNPEGLVKLLRKEGDALGDHIAQVTLPALGFEDDAHAGGANAHHHEETDRACQRLYNSDRLYREDGNDPA